MSMSIARLTLFGFMVLVAPGTSYALEAPSRDVTLADPVVPVCVWSADAETDAALDMIEEDCDREWYLTVEEAAEATIALAAVGVALEVCGATMGLTCLTVPWVVRQSYKEVDDFMEALGDLEDCLARPENMLEI